jgi:hypothetical protein
MPKLGQIVDTSHSGGRTVWQSWLFLFDQNEKFWKDGAIKRIRTDRQIAEQMREWFPQRHSTLMKQVSRQRAVYNRRSGKVVSYRYVRSGDKHVARATARGVPMSEWKTPR